MTSKPVAADSGFHPTLAWVYGSLARIVAMGLGSGLLRPAPGTWGSALGWVLWVLALAHLPDWAVGVVLGVSFAYGCWACDRVGKELGRPDDSGMVWDEIVAIWLVLWLVPQTLIIQALAFLIFRFFDIVKPAPIRYFDRKLKNGLGVMWDDLLAAGYTLLVLFVLLRLEVL